MNESLNILPDDGWNHDDFAGFDPVDAVVPDMWTDEPSVFGFLDDAPNGFDEPELKTEFAGGISQSLHPDSEVANLLQTLELDNFLACVTDMTPLQRDDIEKALSGFTAKKLANWLQWMNRKKWTGKSLLLFLRFYDLWVRTPIWWEHIFFSATSGDLRVHYNRSALSRDRCYALVHLRLEHPPETVIDKSWLEDWGDSRLWGCGFGSFASFAIFRASLPPGEDWRLHIDLGSRNGHHDEELRIWQIYSEWWSYLYEWRDNLT